MMWIVKLAESVSLTKDLECFLSFSRYFLKLSGNIGLCIVMIGIYLSKDKFLIDKLGIKLPLLSFRPEL